MPKSKKRPKAVAKQRWERSQRPKTVANQLPEISLPQELLTPPLLFELPILRSPELERALEPRKDWELDLAHTDRMDCWEYMPSIPDGWDDSYEGGGTTVIPNEDGELEVDPPSFKAQLSEFRRIYASVEDLFQDIEAIERWRHPVTGPPPGATHGRTQQDP